MENGGEITQEQIQEFMQKAEILESEKEKLEFEVDLQCNIKKNLEVRIKEDQRLKQVAEEALTTYQEQTDSKMKRLV